MSLGWTLERIRRAGFVAILRGDDPEALIERGVKLAEVGVKAMEITLDSTDAARVFKTLHENLGDEVMMGVGTVLHPESALPTVAEWGAEFALSPVNPDNFVALSHELDILAVPGVGTPDEMWKAHTSGAMIVKLYPASTHWSPSMIAGLPGPFRMVNMLPTGGIEPEEVVSWLDAGATACGIGGRLTVESADLLSSEILARRGVLR